MNDVTITLLLPEEEAKKYMIFQEYYEPITLLIERNVFKQKNAAISLHFDNNGVLQTIQRADFLYSRRHEESYPHQ